MKIRKYKNYIKEDLAVEFERFSSVKEELLNLISNSVTSEDMDLVKEFIDSFIKDSETTQIEGLINDSDIYDFYLKFISDIDEILNENNFFEIAPQENGVLGLYDYIVNGTLTAVEYLVEEIRNEID